MHQDERAQDALTLLAAGEVEVRGRMPWSSNGTYLVEVTTADACMPAVYKPVRGERPLWDFPHGLWRREVAAWIVSETFGWGFVPETVVREGPLGEGSVQRFVPSDFEQHYFSLLEDPARHAALEAICVFDLVVNNTDRKSGHCLLGDDGRVWAIDHGLCFHVDPKLRTVIWDFAGEPIPDQLLADVSAAVGRLPRALAPYLDEDEIAAVVARCERVLRVAVFPDPDPLGRCYPWPLV